MNSEKKYSKGNVSFAALALLGAVTLGQTNNASPPIGTTEKATVKKITDGDTITVVVSKEYNIRMLDCWAPETTKAKTTKEKEAGMRSLEFLKTLLSEGDEIVLHIPSTGRVKDSISFSRYLGRIYKDVDQDGELDDISELMVKNGFATKERVKN